MLIEKRGDGGVQFLAPTAQQRAVRRVLHEGMLEDEHIVGRHAAAENQAGTRKLVESVAQLIGRTAGNRFQDRIGKFAADRSTDLRHLLARRQVVEPRH